MAFPEHVRLNNPRLPLKPAPEAHVPVEAAQQLNLHDRGHDLFYKIE